jgi:hypothetical protein
VTLVNADTGEVVIPKAHPAAELFPLMEGEEFDALVEDVRANGLNEPVWMYDDPDLGLVVLDGRNRWRACTAVGVKPETRRYLGDDPIGFSISQNMQRRHLTAGQKAGVAARALPLYESEAEARRLANLKQNQTTERADRPAREEPSEKAKERARDKAAATAGSSGRSVGRYKRLQEQDPGLANLVDKGTLALDRAERILRDKEAEQRKVEQAKREAEAQPEPLTVDLRLGDFRDVLADVTSVDAIITDPPYPAEFLPILADLAAWADKVLTDDGVLAVLIGQSHLPEVYRLLDGHRPYRWTCCYLTDGPGYVSHPRKVQSNWKPLLVYGGGPRIADVLRSEGSDAGAKSLHKWGQDYSAFHTLIERLTSRGQTVADPFMGSGTTLLAAHALGRHVVGADIDPEAFQTARERLS